jgi:PAS domain S-box-containing protein
MGKVTVARDSSKWLDFRGLSAYGWVPVALFLLLSITCSASAQEPAREKNVLVLESFSGRSLGVVQILKSEVRARVRLPINLYVEYLESRRFDNERYQKDLFETLRLKYGSQKLDLVMPQSYPALQFALRYRNQLFPEVPIVFWGVDITRIPEHKWPGVTGVIETVDIRGTIALALLLHPDTKMIAVITDNSEWDRYWLAAVHAELVRHQDEVRETDLVAIPPGHLLEKVAAFGPQTVVLFQQFPEESIQPAIGSFDVLGWVGQRLPTYCIWPELCLNHGGIGGSGYLTLEEQGSLAAELAGRVLTGERPDNIPLVRGNAQQIRVDWRQLRRWKIPESALPPGSLVLYREPTLWERAWKFVVAGIALILAQSLLIFGLLWQRARRRKAEAVLRESEKRFRVMADTTPALVWMCDQEGKVTYLNERRVAFTGSDPNAGYGDIWTEYVHPNDLKNVLDALGRSLKSHQPFSREYRLRHCDGVYRWMFDVASPRVNGDGSFAGFIGSAVDITDQKLAQEALQGVSGRLIEAEEKERKRIARDLHDDISQKLSLLSIHIERANRSADGSAAVTKELLAEAYQHCSVIAHDVQSLSHQLHNSRLDYLGVVFAIRSFCQELAKQHELNIEFSDTNVPSNLPEDVSLCLFRVAQEALHNAVKYSGVRQFAVSLNATENEVELLVRDAGAGFNLEAAKRNRGLGLVSMQERMNLVHGRLEIESKPGEGTKIAASVPVPAAAA